MNEQELKDIFYNGKTHAVHIDNDSVIIDGRDRTPCMYEYAKEILCYLQNA